MRKLFLVFILMCCLAVAGYAQINKVFLDASDAVSDSAKAKSYLIYRQLSDSVWFVKQYDIDNSIMCMGTYKDANLSIQNGKFTYYRKSSVGDKNAAPTNYVKEMGSFVNGKRSGEWVSYFPNGMKLGLDTYVNDQLNGLHETYNDDDTVARVRGYYVNDMKDGEWVVVSRLGKTMSTERYKDGKITKTTFGQSNFKSAVPPKGFSDYISNNIIRILKADSRAKIFVTCTITQEGKLLDPKLTGDKIEDRLRERLLQALIASALWTAPYDIKLKQYIKDEVGFIIEIKNNTVEVRYSEKANNLWHQVSN